MAKSKCAPDIRESIFEHRLSFVACCTCKWSSYQNARTVEEATDQWRTHAGLRPLGHELVSVHMKVDKPTGPPPQSMVARFNKAMKVKG